MADVRLEIEIAAPIKKVFDFVADVETHPLYAGHFVRSVRITSTKRKGIGVTFQQVQKKSGLVRDSEIIEFIQNERVTWITRGSSGETLVNYWFKETPTGTKVIHAASSPAFDDPIRRASVYEDNEKELANMKKMMEER